jgi:hypothetical protein
MHNVAVAVFLCGSIFAVAWGCKGCGYESESTKVYKANVQVKIEQEKTKQIQYQWKIDSLKGN